MERVALTVVSDASQLEELKWWQQGDTALETANMIEARQGNRRKEQVLKELEGWWEAALLGSFSATLDRGDGEGARHFSVSNDDGQGEVCDRDTGSIERVHKPAATTLSSDMIHFRLQLTLSPSVHLPWCRTHYRTPQLTALTRERYVTIFTKIALALLEADEREDPEASLEECRQLANEAWDSDAKGAETLPKHKWLDSLFELADTWTVGVAAQEYATFLASLFYRTAEREKRTRAIVFRSDDEVKAMPPQGEEEGEGDDEDEDEDELGPMKGRGRAGRHEGAQRGVRQNGGSGAGSRMVKSSQDTRRDGGGGTKAGSRDGGGGARAGSRSRAERDAIQAKRKEGR